MISTGLCSVTLRALAIDAVVDVTARAGLECIEWAGDSHVPAGDLEAARKARVTTEAAGLRVASYGSYYRCDGAASFAPVLASARALGAPRIRIWAGALPSAEAGPRERDAVAAAARAAAGHGIQVAFEFHGGTLTDEIDSALALIEASGVHSYWQPPQDLPDAESLAGLRRLPRVPAVHVFSWWPGNTRRRLAERGDLWRAVFEHFTDGDALLEFVPGDDPDVVAAEAEELRRVQA